MAERQSFDEFLTALPRTFRRLYMNGAYKLQDLVEAILNVEPRKWDAIIHYCKQLETTVAKPVELFAFVKDNADQDLVLEVEVPEDYEHSTYLEKAWHKPSKSKKKDFSGFKLLNPRDFHDPSRYLRPRERFLVRMVEQVGESATYNDQLVFLAEHRAEMPGAHGLQLLLEQHGVNLPAGKFLTNPDREDHLVRVRMRATRNEEWHYCQLAIIKQEAVGPFHGDRHNRDRLVGKHVIFFLWQKVP